MGKIMRNVRIKIGQKEEKDKPFLSIPVNFQLLLLLYFSKSIMMCKGNGENMLRYKRKQ